MAEFSYSQNLFLRFTVTLFYNNLDENITSNKQKVTSNEQWAKSSASSLASSFKKLTDLFLRWFNSFMFFSFFTILTRARFSSMFEILLNMRAVELVSVIFSFFFTAALLDVELFILKTLPGRHHFQFFLVFFYSIARSKLKVWIFFFLFYVLIYWADAKAELWWIQVHLKKEHNYQKILPSIYVYEI